MNAHVQQLLLPFASPKPSAESDQPKSLGLFGFWRSSLLPQTKAAFLSAMSFTETLLLSISEHVVDKEPVIRTEIFSVGNDVRWDETNVPAKIRRQLGDETMTIVHATVVSDDAVISFGNEGPWNIPNVRYSHVTVSQLIVKRASDAKMFVAPSYFFTRAR